MDKDQRPDQLARTSPIKRFGSLVNDFEYFVSAFALLALVFLLTISIGARYVGGTSVPWSEEVSRFMFIAVIFASISYAARQHRHIRVTMFVEKAFSKRAQQIVLTLGDLVWLGYNAVVLYAAYVVIADLFEFPFKSAVLNLPMYFVYAIIPIFFVTISIRIVQSILARLSGQNIDGYRDELDIDDIKDNQS